MFYEEYSKNIKHKVVIYKWLKFYTKEAVIPANEVISFSRCVHLEKHMENGQDRSVMPY